MLSRAGWHAIGEAIGAIGWGGFALYAVYSLGLVGVLGAAWWSVAPGERGARLPLFAWARLVREGVADLLPLSQLGGFAASARVLHAARIPTSRIYASMVADQAAEMASQLVFTIAGLGLATALLAGDAGAPLRPVVLGAVAVLAAMILVFLTGQRRMIAVAGALVRRLMPRAGNAIVAIDAELTRVYAHRGRIACCFGLNILGWIGTALGAWIVLRLIGHRMAFGQVLSIESMIAVVRSVAFAVPGAIGFQEAAYALLGPLFGLPPAAALALSLAKRARDVLLGVLGVLSWQIAEAIALTRRRSGER